MELTRKDKNLIKEAEEILSKRKSKRTNVGCALMTKDGKIYTGINITCESDPCSICAEYSAVSRMYSEGENKIKTIVSVHEGGNIISPCGKCREFIYELTEKDKEVEVIISHNNKIKLGELFPYPWI